MRKVNPLFLQLFETRPSKGDLKKFAIIEAGIRVLARDGIQDTTLDSIGKELGIRRSHVAYYFKEVDPIVEAAIRFSIATGQEIVIRHIEKALSPKSQLIAYIRGTFEWVSKHPDQLSLVYLMYYNATFNKQWRELNTKFKEVGRGRVQSLIEKAWKGKSISKSKLFELSRCVHNVLVVNVLEKCTTKSKLSCKQLTDATIQTALTILGPKFR